MPFRSAAQERWAFSTHQPFAREWAAITPPNLPQHVQKGKPVASNFDKLASKLSQRPGVTNPRALAAYIGRKKDGPAAMAKGAATGRPAADFVRKGK